MPPAHLKQVERYFTSPLVVHNSGYQTAGRQQVLLQKRAVRHPKKRKHNDSISESKLIKEKLPSSSLSTIGRTNILIPRSNQKILENIDLTDGVAIKQLINNNNGDLHLDSSNFSAEENDNGEYNGDSDSETVTGDESLLDQDDESEPDD